MNTNDPNALSIDEMAQKFIKEDILINQSCLVEELLTNQQFSYDDIENFYTETDSEPKTIYEWWVVSAWIADQLRTEGEPILDNDYGTWWGRTCTGQNILMDGTLQEIATRLKGVSS